MLLLPQRVWRGRIQAVELRLVQIVLQANMSRPPAATQRLTAFIVAKASTARTTQRQKQQVVRSVQPESTARRRGRRRNRLAKTVPRAPMALPLASPPACARPTAWQEATVMLLPRLASAVRQGPILRAPARQPTQGQTAQATTRRATTTRQAITRRPVPRLLRAPSARLGRSYR